MREPPRGDGELGAVGLAGPPLRAVHVQLAALADARPKPAEFHPFVAFFLSSSLPQAKYQGEVDAM